MMTLALLPLSVQYIISRVVLILSYLIFISALASWIPQVRDSQIGQALFMLTEPIIAPVRRVLYKIPSLRRLPMDFSPLVTYFILVMIERIVRFI